MLVTSKYHDSHHFNFSVRKILSIKLFDDESQKKWKKNVSERDFEILCVSQFTLYNTWKVRNIYLSHLYSLIFKIDLFVIRHFSRIYDISYLPRIF